MKYLGDACDLCQERRYTVLANELILLVLHLIFHCCGVFFFLPMVKATDCDPNNFTQQSKFIRFKMMFKDYKFGSEICWKQNAALLAS